MRKLKLDDWIATQRRRKWRWVQKLAKTEDFDWMVMTTRWDPTIDDKLNARRRPGRPKTRWMDDITNHVTRTTTDARHNNANSNDDDRKTPASNDDTLTTDPVTIDNMLIIKMATDETAWAAMEEGYVNNIF